MTERCGRRSRKIRTRTWPCSDAALHDLLQGLCIVAVIDVADGNRTPGELLIAGVGVLARRAFIDVLLDIEDALVVQVAVDIDAQGILFRKHVEIPYDKLAHSRLRASLLPLEICHT